MEVRIVKKCGKEYISFFNGLPIKNKGGHIDYKKNDVVLIGKNEEIKKYQMYKNLMDYLYENHTSKMPNRSLVINKFTNVFNLDKSYYSMSERANDEEKEILTKIERDINCIKMSLHSRFDFLSFNGDIVDKLIIGLGNESVFETGITLHHTYGIPYIPGQAIKGIFRNYVIQNYFQKCDCECSKDCQKICEKGANKHKGFSLIFGSKDDDNKNTAGRVIFMDSFPKDDFKLVKDVMTPHHKDYYNGDSMPLDLDDPTPIPFWILDNQHLTFQFNIAIDKNISDLLWNEENSNLTIKEFLVDNLIDALNNHGIGAKTSVGYGYFDINKESVKKQIKEEFQEKERLKVEENLKKEGKSDFEVKLYYFKESLKNESLDGRAKNDMIMKFYSCNITSLKGKDKILLAIYMKKYLENVGEWKIKGNKKKKVKKKIEEICDILNIELSK